MWRRVTRGAGGRGDDRPGRRRGAVVRASSMIRCRPWVARLARGRSGSVARGHGRGVASMRTLIDDAIAHWGSRDGRGQARRSGGIPERALRRRRPAGDRLRRWGAGPAAARGTGKRWFTAPVAPAGGPRRTTTGQTPADGYTASEQPRPPAAFSVVIAVYRPLTRTNRFSTSSRRTCR